MSRETYYFRRSHLNWTRFEGGIFGHSTERGTLLVYYILLLHLSVVLDMKLYPKDNLWRRILSKVYDVKKWSLVAGFTTNGSHHNIVSILNNFGAQKFKNLN